MARGDGGDDRPSQLLHTMTESCALPSIVQDSPDGLPDTASNFGAPNSNRL